MLDLSRTVRRLAQGQRAAELTLVRRTGRAAVPAEADTEPRPADERPGAASVDASAVAERVYQLMRQELRTYLERRA